MSAEVETMMFVGRERPWHGLGTMVEEAPDSREALIAAGLDWDVVQRPVFTQDGVKVPGYFANVRQQDGSILGVVTSRYKVVQNRDAFAFTDALLGDGVRYETAGSLMGGRKTWILAKLPTRYIIQGEQILPYLVFSNTHDGSGAIKIAMTPIRVVCNNTLNLALDTANRSWSIHHTGDIQVFFLCDEFHDSRIDVTGTGSHNNAFQWSQTHGCIYTFTVYYGTDGRSVTQVANDYF